MDNVEKDNLIVQKVRDFLDNGSQPYTEGAWENFVEYRKRKRRRVYLKYGVGAAACLLALLITFHALQPDGETLQPHREATVSSVVTESRTSPGAARSDLPLVDPEAPGKNLAGKRSPSKDVDLVQATGEVALIDAADPSTKRDNDQLTGPIDQRNDEQPAGKRTEEIKADETEEEVLREGNERKERGSESWQIARGGRGAASSDRIRIGLNISPAINSATSNAAFAFSGGITADIRLTSTLFVSTGLLAEHQQFSSSRPNREFMGIDNSLSGDMVSIDIPLNIGWKFINHPNRNYYVTGGVSSLAYLSEKYQNTERWQEVVERVRESGGEEFVEYEVVTRETTSRESAAPFHNFHPFGRLNLTVGMEQKITKGVSFHVEPYLKIPLSGMGDEAIRITTGGVNFKVSF